MARTFTQQHLLQQGYLVEQGWPLPGMPFLDLFHAIGIARELQKNAEPAPLVQSLVAYILCSAGGTSVGSILLGQPIGWLCSDVTVCTYLLIFALSYSRFTRDIFRFIVNLEPFATIISVVDDMSWGNCITMLGVQRALNPMHAASPVKNSASAAILLGTLAGCGGGLLRFLFALVFYALTNPHGYLTLPAAATDLGAHFLHVHDAKWIIITLCIAVNTGANLIGIGASAPAAAPKAVSSSIVSVTASQPKAVAPAESSSSAPVKAAKETPKPLDEDEDDSADAPVSVSKAGKRASSGRKTK